MSQTSPSTPATTSTSRSFEATIEHVEHNRFARRIDAKRLVRTVIRASGSPTSGKNTVSRDATPRRKSKRWTWLSAGVSMA
jgi:hypothetical protein